MISWNFKGVDLQGCGDPDLDRPGEVSVWCTLPNSTLDGGVYETFTISIPKLSIIDRIIPEAKRLPADPNLPGTNYQLCNEPSERMIADVQCEINHWRWIGFPVVDETGDRHRMINWRFVNLNQRQRVRARLTVKFFYIESFGLDASRV